MSTQTRGLGRGLGALIPPLEAGTAEVPGGPGVPATVREISITEIVPNPRQPRAAVLPETLSELADSIREHGVIQPIIVTRTLPTGPGPYQIIAGERRWRAAQLAGMSTIPAIIKEATPEQLLELALVENIQREDLNPLEEAEAYRSLMEDFGLKQGEVAEKVGKSRVAVANTLRLLRLPEVVKALLTQGALSEGHARALLALSDEDAIIQAAEQVVARELSVRQTEELVHRLTSSGVAPTANQEEVAADDTPGALYTRRLEDEFRDALGTKVSLTRGPRGGRLVISFYSEEELQAIYDRIIHR